MEDALKIEQELGRVTESIELLKGGIQVLEARIAFSASTVKLNSPIPQQAVKQEIPFPWVLQLGSDLVTGSRGANRYCSTRGRHRCKVRPSRIVCVAVALRDKHVVTHEAWGPIVAFGKVEDAIKKSISTVRL